ncbi:MULTISPECIES: glutamate ABC transporter substrate-binding protein [Streptomyces]|uniref:Transporter substrate-binding domain-containing protein n=1 Tax=Streptomyces changanensis TaxID=2964669 RepID=A0ABY5N4E2_9ACTN|nr:MULTISPECIES: glutamate ABC transporter substrate-binding protein [Streptomyces]UUS31078.1 transporter substrate-binding domain-containing protein [Streptomyces changanensis]
MTGDGAAAAAGSGTGAVTGGRPRGTRVPRVRRRGAVLAVGLACVLAGGQAGAPSAASIGAPVAASGGASTGAPAGTSAIAPPSPVPPVPPVPPGPPVKPVPPVPPDPPVPPGDERPGAVRPVPEARPAAEPPLPARSGTCRNPEASLPPSRAEGPAVAAIRARGRLVVGVDQNSYRWGYRDSVKGTLEGFDIDLARAIAADLLGSPDAIVFRTVPTDQRIAALVSGKVDLVVRTMTINCARIRQVAFSTAYFETGQQVLAPKDSPITGYDASLAGRRVCTAEGSTAYEALDRAPLGAVYRDAYDGTARDADRLTVPNQLDCLVRLQTGEVDAVVTDSALAAGQAAQDPAVELKGEPFTTEYYGVAARLGADDLVRRVNQVLVAYRAGPWTKAYEKWLEADLPGITGPPAPMYRTNRS